MTLTRRERLFVIVGLVVVTAALYLVYFLLPYIQDTNDAAARLGSAQTQLSTLRFEAAGVQKLDGEIAELNEKLSTQWACVPTGVDHARILLYLKKLTDGRAEGVGIAAPNPVEADGSFLRQTLAVEFNTSYGNLLSILGDLKRNELYNRVALMTADYRPEGAEAAGESGDYVIAVHLELSFVALAPAEGEEPAPAMAPTSRQRQESLMPVK